DRAAKRRAGPARERPALCLQPAAIRCNARSSRPGRALRHSGAPAGARAGGAERVSDVERAGAGVDAARLWLSARAVLRDRSARCAGAPRRPAQMNSDPRDRPWRLWASVTILAAFAFSVLFGFVLLPIIQGRSAGIDAFDSICRALGLRPGSPAARQPVSEAKAHPTT